MKIFFVNYFPQTWGDFLWLYGRCCIVTRCTANQITYTNGVVEGQGDDSIMNNAVCWRRGYQNHVSNSSRRNNFFLTILQCGG